MSAAWAIETRGLAKRYGSVDAVKPLDLHVARGGITGFPGRNGAGKSTTIKMLLGMVRPTAGTAAVVSHRIDDRRSRLAIRRRIAYVAEDKRTYAFLTVAQMIRFTRSFYDDWQPGTERRLTIQYGLPAERKVKALSKGMRTKLALLLALSRRPARHVPALNVFALMGRSYPDLPRLAGAGLASAVIIAASAWVTERQDF